MEPIAQSAFVVYLNMSSIDAGSFKQVQKNGKVFYDFENFTGRVGTRLFATEGSESIEIGRSEESAPDNNTRPGSRKGVTTNKERSGKRGQKKLSVAALSISDASSSGSDDESSVLMEDDSDDMEELKECLKTIRTSKSVRFMEESESKSEEESSKEGDSVAEESEKEEGGIERNEEASEEQEGKEEAHNKKEEDNADGNNGGNDEGIGGDCNKKLPIKNYVTLKKQELEMECRLRDLTSDGKKAILIERLQKNDQEEAVTEHEDNGQDEVVQEKRTSRRRNTRRR